MAVIALRFVNDDCTDDALINVCDSRNGPEAQVRRPEVETVHRKCICTCM